MSVAFDLAYPTPPSNPLGWLYGWVDTDSPGFRKIYSPTTLATYTAPAAASTRFPQFLNALDGAVPWSFSVGSDGRLVVGTYGGAEMVWSDRLGWILGFDVEARFTEGVVTPPYTARAISPACIPLFERLYERVDREQERSLIVDRFGRGHGYVYGAADVWRWQIRLHRTGLKAFNAGWVRRGQVTFSGSNVAAHIAGSATPWSAAAPGGFVDCRVLGLEGPPEPLDTLRQWYTVRMLAVTGV